MKTETCLVVLGLDADQKPRACKFDVAYEKAARKIAAVQRFKIGHPKTDDAIEQAIRLVDGKTFQSGKGLVPLVSPVTYENLLKVLEIEEIAAETQPATKGSPAPKANSSPAHGDGDPTASIGVGSIILCQDNSPKKTEDRGWWPCSVLSLSKNGQVLSVRWAHFPTMKPFSVARKVVAKLPPKG